MSRGRVTRTVRRLKPPIRTTSVRFSRSTVQIKWTTSPDRTGVEDYLGAPMFCDHADADTYLRWLHDDGFEVLWHRYIPEGDVGHTLVLASRPATER